MQASALFRQEVYASNRQRLVGELVLVQPLAGRLVTPLIVIGTALVIAWLVVGTYARIEPVRGALMTDRPTARITATAGGVVSRMLVQEGEAVERDQPLLTIAVDRSLTEGRGAAELGIEALDMRIENVGKQLLAARQRHVAESEKVDARLAAAHSQLQLLAEQVTLQRQIVASQGATLAQLESAMNEGYISRLDYERRRQTLLEARQRLASMRTEHAARLAQQAQEQADRDALAARMSSDIAELDSNLQALRQQRAQLEGERMIVIRAPLTGRVTALQAAVGAPTSPGGHLLTVVPSDTRVRAIGYAPSRAIGFLQPGAEARVLFDSFPYERFGSHAGKVRSISRSPIDPREVALPVEASEPVYRVEIDLERQDVAAMGQRWPLQPGMAFTANLVLDRQSFADWLLAPIYAARNRT